MASTLTADNGVSTGSAGLKSAADSTGVLALRTTTAGGTATTALTIDTSQNAGLGVTPSTWSTGKVFEIGSPGNALWSSTGYTTLLQNGYFNAGYKYGYTGLAGRYDIAAGVHAWYTAPSGTAGNAITFTQAMTLDASGNLLVGTTTSPAGSKELVLGGDYIEGVVAIGTVTTASTISLANGTVQTATLTASTACTFTMPTAVAGKSFIMLLKQAATTGNGTATFTSVKWSSAGAPTITATAGKMDILSFVSDGTNWYGSYTQGYTP